VSRALAVLFFAFCLLPFAFAQQPPTLTAHWTAPRSAVITWESSASLVCLYRETREGWRYFLQCYAGGSGEITLPWRDWTTHVRPSDSICADFDQERVCVPIVSPVWLPLVREGEVQEWRVWAPLITAA
jgi:hypothetical protein